MIVHNHPKFIDRRRELRQSATPEENLLWEELRNNKPGYKFRRQHDLGGYILDFYCAKKRLIIEIDGEVHKFQKEYDRIRDTYFIELDYRILRFKNEEIANNLISVVDKIKQFLKLPLS